jgi:ribonuclease H2 subunit A
MVERESRANLWISQNCPIFMDYSQVITGKERSSCQMVRSVSCSSRVLMVFRTDEGQASLIKAFETSKGLDKDRCLVAKDLQLSSVSTL